jgi:hypothetical protein
MLLLLGDAPQYGLLANIRQHTTDSKTTGAAGTAALLCFAFPPLPV